MSTEPQGSLSAKRWLGLKTQAAKSRASPQLAVSPARSSCQLLTQPPPAMLGWEVRQEKWEKCSGVCTAGEVESNSAEGYCDLSCNAVSSTKMGERAAGPIWRGSRTHFPCVKGPCLVFSPKCTRISSLVSLPVFLLSNTAAGMSV